MRFYARVTVTTEFLLMAGAYPLAAFRGVVGAVEARALAHAEREGRTPAPGAKWHVQSRPSATPEAFDILVSISTWALPPKPSAVEYVEEGTPW